MNLIKWIEMKRDKILKIILIILYIPISLYGFLSYMGMTGIIGETNITIIILTNIACYMGLFMPIIVITSLLVAKWLYNRKNTKQSIVVSFFPLIVILLIVLLSCLVDIIRNYAIC